MVQNWIGSFQFISLSGTPVGITPGTQLMTRPGVAGVAMWLSGSRGRQFTLRSGCDMVNVLAASIAYYNYRALVGSNPTDLMVGDVTWTSTSIKVLVLDVTPVGELGIRGLLGGVGGLNPPSQGYLECDWTLCFVDVS